jgi:hypothetical protein
MSRCKSSRIKATTDSLLSSLLPSAMSGRHGPVSSGGSVCSVQTLSPSFAVCVLQVLPAVYLFVGRSLNATPVQLGTLTLCRAMVQVCTHHFLPIQLRLPANGSNHHMRLLCCHVKMHAALVWDMHAVMLCTAGRGSPAGICAYWLCVPLSAADAVFSSEWHPGRSL